MSEHEKNEVNELSQLAEDNQDPQSGMDKIKAIFEDGVMTIKGERDYKFTRMKHKHRVKVFSFLSTVTPLIKRGDYAWLDWEAFTNKILPILEDSILFDGMSISKRNKINGSDSAHWDEYPQDYLIFVNTAMPVIAYPLMQGNAGN